MQDAITLETTRKIAKLARLQISEEEAVRYTKDLAAILGYVEKLNAVNTENIEPLVHGLELPDHFREDKVTALSEEDIKSMLACSDQILYEQYKVPQVIGEA